MTLEVVFSADAEQDLDDLFYWIAERVGVRTAMGYTDRLRAFCESLGLFPERARMRPEIDPEVRIVGFEGRTNIGYLLTASQVVIVSLDHGGRPFRRVGPQPSRSSE